MGVRTIALTLRPNADQQAALARLQRTFSAACNAISETAWHQREFNTVRLQRLVYAEVRARFGLLAQHTVRAVAVVADSYKADRRAQHTFRADAAVPLDTPRLYRIAHNRASLATLDGRLKVQLGIGGHQRRMLAQADKLAEADLVCDRKGRWRLLVSAHFADPPPRQITHVLGVDLGRTDIAHTSQHETFSGHQVTAVRDRYTNLRRSLQATASKGTRSTRRRARAVHKRISGRERRFQRDWNHRISKCLVVGAVRHGYALACEDLSGIRARTSDQPRTKTERRRATSWAFFQLRHFLAYTCQAAGVPFVLVPPAYTSRTCHACLRLGRRAGKVFACQHPACAWRGDADYNAACNIAHLGRTVMAPGGPSLACQWHPSGRATTSSRALARRS